MLSLVRLRRHRVTIAIAIFIVIVLYQLSSLKSPGASSTGYDRLKEYTTPEKPYVPPPKDVQTQASVPAPKPKIDSEPVRPPPPMEVPLVEDKPKTSSEKPYEEKPHEEKPHEEKPHEEKPKAPAAPLTTSTSTSTTIPGAVEAPDETVAPTVPEPRPGGHHVPVQDSYPDFAPTEERYSYPTPYYPIPSPLISIPPPPAAAIPQIQADFAPEGAKAKRIRLMRKQKIKDAFVVSWNAYKTYAMPHDELRPVTLSHKDPFGGWGATLVDALDTLWIMGLTKEFNEAVELVGNIDFTTNSMGKMRVFETVIRYLGGLVGAWDLATEGGEGKAYKGGDKEGYKVLLDKAQELAGVLLGAFDTPNRMPILSWDWRLKGLARHPRAETRSVASELGSLSMEFTRLAQITGNASYYDAVARITNALDEFQMNTTFPGLWPIYIDASGCKRIRRLKKGATTTTAEAQKKPPADPLIDEEELRVEAKVGGTGRGATPDPQSVPVKRPAGSSDGSDSEETPIPAQLGGTGKEVLRDPQLVPVKRPGAGGATSEKVPMQVPAVVGGTGTEVEVHVPEKRSKKGPQPTSDDDFVVEKPLKSAKSLTGDEAAPWKPQGAQDTGGYEPIPAKPQHGAQSTDDDDVVVRKPKPLMRPDRCQPQGLAAPHLIREEKYGLGAMIDSLYEYLLKQYLLLGGNEQYKRMYSAAMDVAGTKLTYRPMAPMNPDILLAGNVYVSRAGTKRRFEPESSHLACFAGGMFAMGARALGREKDLEIGNKLTAGCAWAYGAMESGIMPESFRMAMCPDKKDCIYKREKWVETIMLAEGFADPQPTTATHTSPEAAAVAGGANSNARPEIFNAVSSEKDDVPQHELARHATSEDDTTPVHQAEKRQDDASDQYPAYELKTAKELTEDLIDTDSIPEGFTRLVDKRYILRPEAIESVWYMYRISGNGLWAEKGWEMWKSTIEAVTVETEDGSEGAASAIEDVNLKPTSEEFVWLNSMESFWFGETLKYYYLLFSTPDTISLDEYVLNTEAHPFRRADFGKSGKTAVV